MNQYYIINAGDHVTITRDYIMMCAYINNVVCDTSNNITSPLYSDWKQVVHKINKTKHISLSILMVVVHYFAHLATVNFDDLQHQQLLLEQVAMQLVVATYKTTYR